MCEYCEKGKKFAESKNDKIHFEIYGKHLRFSGYIFHIFVGRDVLINYCPMCRKKGERVNIYDYEFFYEAYIKDFSEPSVSNYVLWIIMCIMTIPVDILTLPIQILGIIAWKIDLWKEDK